MDIAMPRLDGIQATKQIQDLGLATQVVILSMYSDLTITFPGAGRKPELLFIPLVTHYNTGMWQFGNRFSLDLMTPVLALLALAAGQRVG